MAIKAEHITGFVAGLGLAGAGYYLYKKNRTKVDEFLRKQGIEMPGSSGGDYSEMSLHDLVAEKERLEDMIAEREMAEQAEGTEGEESEA